MATPGGRWVSVPLPNGGERQDWVPVEQPPPEGALPGEWHVVDDPRGGESAWEWHLKPAPIPPRNGGTPAASRWDAPPRYASPSAGGYSAARSTGGWDTSGLPGARDPRWNPWRAAARPFVAAVTILAVVGVVTLVGLMFVGLWYAHGGTGSSYITDDGSGSITFSGGGTPWWLELITGILGLGTLAAAILVLIGTFHFAVLAWRITEPVPERARA